MIKPTLTPTIGEVSFRWHHRWTYVIESPSPYKRARTDHGPSYTPSNKAHIERTECMPRLTLEETITKMDEEFSPFENYIQNLADGKLDGYLDSIGREDKVSHPDVTISKDLFLLLHNLGKYLDEERINKLFIPATTFAVLYAT
jgi:hypothetical protein